MAMVTDERSPKRIPPEEMLKGLYKSLYNSINKQIIRKMRDSNSMRTNTINPFLREVKISYVPRIIFNGIFSHRVNPRENSREVVPSKTTSPLFKFSTIERLCIIFGNNNLFKFHSSGDVSIITPWLKLTVPWQNTSAEEKVGNVNECQFEVGRLLLPLQETESTFKVFIPCAGPDPETDKLPLWCKSYKITEIFSFANIDPESLYFASGKGVITARVNDDWTLMSREKYGEMFEDQVKEMDFIKVRGNTYQVYAVSVDFNTDYRNCVRITSKFLRNVNKQKFTIAKLPIIQGLIVEIPKQFIEQHSTLFNIIDTALCCSRTYCRNT